MPKGQDPITQAKSAGCHQTTDRLNQFCTETAHDEQLSLVKHIVHHGWLEHIHEEIQPHWTFREEITIEDGIYWKELIL